MQLCASTNNYQLLFFDTASEQPVDDPHSNFMNTTMSQLPARPAESAALTALKSNIIWPKELMEVLGYKSRSPFWQAVRDLRIPCVKVNARKVYFLRPQVEAWLDNQTRAYK